MPEIGLLPFAHVAMDVAHGDFYFAAPTGVVISANTNSPTPQLLAILCLMRCTKTGLSAKPRSRLREHAELRCRAAAVERARLHHRVSLLAAAA